VVEIFERKGENQPPTAHHKQTTAEQSPCTIRSFPLGTTQSWGPVQGLQKNQSQQLSHCTQQRAEEGALIKGSKAKPLISEEIYIYIYISVSSSFFLDNQIHVAA